MTLRVALQQRRRLYREGLAVLLGDEPDVELAGTATTGEDLLALCMEATVEVALLELDATAWDPCRLAHRIQRISGETRFVGMYPAEGSEEWGSVTKRCVSRARQAHIRHIVSRADGIDGLMAILRAAGRDRPVSILIPPLDAHPSGSLTPREIDVLELIGAGWSSRQISEKLSITHKTVENHKQRIFGKLGVQNQAHAVAVAIRQGLIRPDGVIDITDRALGRSEAQDRSGAVS
jgi:DNA-binding NarL/FixJ family response regulator